MGVESLKTFGQTDRVVEGWYWLLRAGDLKKKQVKPVEVLGRDLAVYRSETGKVVALDAHCPHMGAHFAEGKVDGEGIRCFFHNWKFDAQGCVEDVPCSKTSVRAEVTSWPVEEKYGLIWIYTGEAPKHPIPYVPELENEEVDYFLGSNFQKGCHPNVVMINAIDAHHFTSVHHLPVDLSFACNALNENNMTFENTTKMPTNSMFTRFASQFYKDALTYKMSYWFGNTGTVTVGPDFLHFHIMFALRLNAEGRTEGQTILMTKKRPGLLGWAFNKILLFLSWVVGTYFAHGDTKVFETIKFKFKTPLKADYSIIKFIQHVEAQKALEWGSWVEENLVQLPVNVKRRVGT